MPNMPVTADSFRRIRIQNTNQNVVADSNSDTLTLVASDGITITADEATDTVTIRAVATLNTAGLDDILFNGNTSTLGIEVGSLLVDSLNIDGFTISAESGSNLSLLATGGGMIVLAGDLSTDNLMPNVNDSYDIGSLDYRYRNMYLTNNSTIYFGGVGLTVSGTGLLIPSGSVFNGQLLSSITIPDPVDHPDEFLISNGTTAYWGNLPDIFPSRTNQGGKFLTTDGSLLFWDFTPSFNGGTITEQLTVQNDVLITGSLTVNGSTTIINSSTIQVDDKNIELGSIDSPTDITADGGGITLKGDTDKTITWNLASGFWNFSDGISAPSFTGTITASGGSISNITSASFASGETVTRFSSDGTLSDSSNSNVPTENAVKTYVDNTAVLIDSEYSNPSFIVDLSISQGGTGARSAGDALNNLLPSGEQPGYILKTNGPGTYFWASELGQSVLLGNRITTSRTLFTATEGQTVFENIGNYTIGTGQLRVFIDGVRQFPSAYTETTETSFTLLIPVTAGTQVFAEVDAYMDYTIFAAAITFDNAGTDFDAITVQEALVELNVEKVNRSGDTITGDLEITSTTASTSETTGALTVSGGVGVDGNINLSGSIGVGGSIDLVGDIVCAGNVISQGSIETFITIDSADGLTEHNFQDGNVWVHTNIANNIIVDLINMPTTSGRSISIAIIIEQGSIARTISSLRIDGIDQTIRWLDSVIPLPSTNATDMFTFSILRIGSTWRIVGSKSSFS